MISLSKDKWLDIREGLLSTVDYEVEKEKLFRFDERSNGQVEYGEREVYLFEKAGAEVKMQVDIVQKTERHEAQGKNGEIKMRYEDIDGEKTYRLSVFIKDQYGSWKDSSAFEEGFSL